MSDEVNVRVSNEPLSITIEDRTSPTVEVTEQPVQVVLEGSARPVVNVGFGGGRGPIWLPGNTYDATSLAAILTDAITRQQLSIDLREELTATEVGLTQARQDLDEAIQTLNETGNLVDTTVTRMNVAEDNITLQASRLSAAEASISTAQLFIDDSGIRLSAAEGALAEHDNFIATQELIVANEWTVKIHENLDGTATVAGVGLLVYQTWTVNMIYEVGEFVWFNGNAYKCKIQNVAAEANMPPNTSYWEYIPYATKSQFGVFAESFFVQTSPDGAKAVPFLIYNDMVIVNGDMIVNGLISAGALSAGRMFTWSIESPNYIPEVSGYKLDSVTGIAEFNNITMTINYSDISGTPNSLGQIDSAAATKLAGIAAGATVNHIFAQTTAPTSGMVAEDLWFDTDDGNKLYRYNGASWALVRDTGITDALNAAAAAQDTADGKIKSFYQATAPASGMSVGDLWFDTDAGNKAYRYSGTAWSAVQDTAIATALNDAATAQATADGKVTTFFTTSTPTAEAIGDLWYNSSTSLLKRWDGASWSTVSNNYTNTAQLVDGANLGGTANWDGVVNIPYDQILLADDSVALGFNPTFSLWPDGQTLPTGWEAAGGAVITKSTITRIGPNSIKFQTTGLVAYQYATRIASFTTAPLPLGTFLAGTCDIYVVSNTTGSGCPGVKVRLFTSADLSVYVDTNVAATLTLGVWQRLLFSARVGETQKIYAIQIFLMAAANTEPAFNGSFNGTVIFDNIRFALFDSTQDAIDPASKINQNSTTIDGGKITAYSITAQQIAAYSITAQQIAAYSITAEQIAAYSITAEQIAARSITADRLAVKAITAESGVIGDLAVDTLQIAGRAVTQPVFATAVATKKIVQTALTSVVTVKITVSGSQPLVITLSGIFWGGGDSGTKHELAARILRNGVEVQALVTISSSIGGACNPFILQRSEAPAAGTYLYDLQLKLYSSTETIGYVKLVCASIMEMKR